MDAFKAEHQNNEERQPRPPGLSHAQNMPFLSQELGKA